MISPFCGKDNLPGRGLDLRKRVCRFCNYHALSFTQDYIICEKLPLASHGQGTESYTAFCRIGITSIFCLPCVINHFDSVYDNILVFVKLNKAYFIFKSKRLVKSFWTAVLVHNKTRRATPLRIFLIELMRIVESSLRYFPVVYVFEWKYNCAP